MKTNTRPEPRPTSSLTTDAHHRVTSHNIHAPGHSAPLVPVCHPASSTQAPVVVDACPLPSPAGRRTIRRNGRIASLPKLHRDMVSHMLWNAVPYKNIVAALDEVGFTVTERNVSNWATGGYIEWSLAQEHVLKNRIDQDHLTDFLRREDAPELPEVGLQAAATRLSQVLLQKLARADDPEAHLDNFSKLVDLLCRLNRELTTTQKLRDNSRRTLGREYDPALVKDQEQLSMIEFERFYSDPPVDSRLPKPKVPAILPLIPTASSMAEEARMERQAAEVNELKRVADILKAFKPGMTKAAKPVQPVNAPRANTPPQHISPPSPKPTTPVSITSR